MKIPTRRIQWLCLAIAVYFLWITVDLILDGERKPKVIAGGILGCVLFTLTGLFSVPEKKKEPMQPPAVAAEASRKD